MKITINGKRIDFESDYSHKNKNWKRKQIDAFSFQSINDMDCFIKRSTKKPSAWFLLSKLKNQTTVNCPQIYDLGIVKENGKKTHYLFTEQLKGETLLEAIQQEKEISIDNLIKDISSAIEFLNKNGFWFSDLNEENIFRTEDGKYFLIDLDSCWKKNIKPTHDSNKLGGLPGKSQTFAFGVFKFYREILKREDYKFNSLDGINLNYLQLVAIAAKIKYYYEIKKTNTEFTYISQNFHQVNLHEFLYQKNPVYFKALFLNGLNRELNPRMLSPVVIFLNQVQDIYEPTSSKTTLSKEIKIVAPKGQRKVLPSNTTQKKKSSFHSLLKWSILIIMIIGGSIFGGNLFISYKYNSYLGEGDAFASKGKYLKAIQSYNSALEFDNKNKIIEPKINDVKIKSVAFFKTKVDTINQLIHLREYSKAKFLTIQIQTADEFTFFIQDSILNLKNKIDAFELVSKGDKFLFEKENIKNIDEAIEAYQTAKTLFSQIDIKGKVENAKKLKTQLESLVNNKQLVTACESGNLEGVINALNQKANPNAQNENGIPALTLAISNNFKEIVSALIQAGAECNSQHECLVFEGNSLGTPLVTAVYFDAIDIIKNLIENGKANIDEPVRNCSENGKLNEVTALGLATKKGNIEVVEYLLAMGANPNIKYGETRRTPLMEASASNHLEIAKKLIEKGAKVNLKDKNGHDAFYYVKDNPTKEYLQGFGLGKFKYFDTFNKGDSKFKNHHTGRGNAEVSNGNLYIKSKVNTYLQTKPFNLNFEEDFTITFRFKLLESVTSYDALFGFIFGGDFRNRNFNVFNIQPNGQCHYVTFIDGKWQPRQSSKKGVLKNHINKIRLQKSGSMIKVYVNKILVYSIVVKKYFGNQIGFFVQGGIFTQVHDLEIIGFQK